jgi:hypothetical protein
MASVVHDGEIMLIVIFAHESRYRTIEAVLGIAEAFLSTRAFIGQVHDFGIISKLFSKKGLQGVHLVDVRVWHM